MNKKSKIIPKIAERDKSDSGNLQPASQLSPEHDAMYSRHERVLQPLSTDLLPSTPSIAHSQPVQTKVNEPEGSSQTGSQDVAVNSQSSQSKFAAIYPTPFDHTSDSLTPAVGKESRASVIWPALVIIVGVLTVVGSGFLLFERMIAFTGGFIRLSPTIGNVSETIALALQALLGIGILMRRNTARKLLIFVSSVMLLWSLFKLFVYSSSANILSQLGVPGGMTRNLLMIITLQIVVNCVAPLFLVIFLTRRHVAELFD